MTKDDESEKSGVGVWVACVLGALVFYVLAPAPLWKLREVGVLPKGGATDQVLGMVFHPIGLVATEVKAVGAFYEWWSRQCGVKE